MYPDLLYSNGMFCRYRYHFQSSFCQPMVVYKTNKKHVSLTAFQHLASHLWIMRVDHFGLNSTTLESSTMKLIPILLNTRCIPWKWIPFIRIKQLSGLGFKTQVFKDQDINTKTLSLHSPNPRFIGSVIDTPPQDWAIGYSNIAQTLCWRAV